MTDKTDLIREIHEYVTTHGGENTATHLLVQAASAIQTQAAELEAVGAGGVQALSAAPARDDRAREDEDLQRRCVECVEWQQTGELRDGALRAYAKKHWPWHHDSLQMAERATETQAMRAVASWGTQSVPPAEQQAAPKAAQYEMDKEASNVRLDIDSNSTKPEQQRDVACSLEVGQHVGNGEHQEASCRGSKDSELLKIAVQNLKYFIEHAQFSSFADKRAALNCLDVLAAPQLEAQEPALFVSAKQLAGLVDPSHATGGSYLPARKTRAGLFTQPLYTAPQPAPAPLSDDVSQKTWALLDELEKLRGADRYDEDWVTLNKRDDELRAALAAQGGTP